MKRQRKHFQILERLTLKERTRQERSIDLLVEQSIRKDGLAKLDLTFASWCTLEALTSDAVVFNSSDIDGARLALFEVETCDHFNDATTTVVAAIIAANCRGFGCLSVAAVRRDFLMPDELKVAKVAKHVLHLRREQNSKTGILLEAIVELYGVQEQVLND